jgi:hypothetical protein
MKESLIYFAITFTLFFGVQTQALTIVSPPQPLLISAIVVVPGGGGGGGEGYTVPTSVTFSGRAYPSSKVSLLKDGQLVITTIAGPDSKFLITLNSGLGDGNYLFSLYGEDSSGRHSTLFNVTLYITSGTATTVSGIFLAPTIAVDKSQVKQGDNLAIFGQSAPTSDIIISVHSPIEIFENTHSDQNGIYLYNLDTSFLNYGQHQTKSKASIANEISTFGSIVTFNVGSSSIFKGNECSVIADLNNDCKVNLVDFSILAYWYRRANLPAKVDLNKDGKINIVDFSIMAYYWTG